MSLENRLTIANADVLKHFESVRAMSQTELVTSIESQKGFWRVSNYRTKEIIEYLLGKTKLQRHRLAFPKESRDIYSWGDVSVYEIALKLGADAYLSHYTAAAVHEIVDDVPKTVYVTVPQPQKREQNIQLTQKQIDQAFSKEARTSKNISKLGDHRIAWLTGMDTQGRGVLEKDFGDTWGGFLKVTNTERTLIDMVVRPSYSGGISKVLDAFRLAAGTMSTNKLVALLKQLQFVYPYHQAIGFLMDRSKSYSETALKMIRALGVTKNFYLDRAMNNPDYDSTWKIYFPKGM